MKQKPELLQQNTKESFFLYTSKYTKACVIFIREKSHQWSCDAISDLTNKEYIRSNRSLCNSFEEKEQKVEPTCDN
jgi:hypothetical protein